MYPNITGTLGPGRLNSTGQSIIPSVDVAFDNLWRDSGDTPRLYDDTPFTDGYFYVSFAATRNNAIYSDSVTTVQQSAISSYILIKI